MIECQRCGECCKVLPLSVSGMSPDYRKYLLQRGLKEDQGFILIPHVCQHLRIDAVANLIGPNGNILESISVLAVPPKNPDNPVNTTVQYKTVCAIHDSPERSLVCRKFTGQKRIGPWRVYVPPNCVFNKKE